MKAIYLFFFLLISAFSYSQNRELYIYGYKGSIGNYPIEMYIEKIKYNDESIIGGYYIYSNSTNDNFLELKGEIVEDRILHLKEYPSDLNGFSETGRFKLKFNYKEKTAEGSWENLKNHQLLNVFLKEISIDEYRLPPLFKPLKNSPSNGRPTPALTMDIDGDGYLDIIQWCYLKRDEEFGVKNYFILISLSNTKRYYITAISGEIDFATNPIKLEKKNDVVSIIFFQEGTARMGRTLKIRWNEKAGEIQIIGYDQSYNPSMSETVENSYNLLTGEIESKFINNEFENSKPKISRSKISNKELFLKDFNYGKLLELDAVFEN